MNHVYAAYYHQELDENSIGIFATYELAKAAVLTNINNYEKHFKPLRIREKTLNDYAYTFWQGDYGNDIFTIEKTEMNRPLIYNYDPLEGDFE